ncbi:TonB family protein [Kluyvera ascorbata]|uniref:TonB family protein n=1 Tax=Kluyvera ascorbata TaxID=51288 RepID=UPI002ABC4016|nr:TonB family protein [Kluyvera ascorbata]MDZ4030654.1 TonB family protein [Kluyvera ascorbata]
MNEISIANESTYHYDPHQLIIIENTLARIIYSRQLLWGYCGYLRRYRAGMHTCNWRRETILMISDIAVLHHPAMVMPPVRRRASLAIAVSVGIHALALLYMAGAFSPPPMNQHNAGKAGGELAVMLFPVGVTPDNVTMLEAEPEIPPVNEPQPAPVERAEIVVPKKQAARKTPAARPQKVAPPKAKMSQPVEAHPLTTEAPKAVGQTSAPTSETSTTPSTQRGESASGQAAQGGGDATSSVTQILHRRVNYPTRARSMGIEGRVQVKFDITPAGTITHIRILSENPPDVFSADLRRDIARWRYRVTGAINDQTVTIIFKLDGHIQLIN